MLIYSRGKNLWIYLATASDRVTCDIQEDVFIFYCNIREFIRMMFFDES